MTSNLSVDPSLAQAFRERKRDTVGFKARIDDSASSVTLVAQYDDPGGPSTAEENFARLTAEQFDPCADCLFLLNARGQGLVVLRNLLMRALA